MLAYPVRLCDTPEGKVRVIFLDVPEAVAEADTEQDALFQAKFALDLSLGNYVLHDRPIPAPSDVPDAPTVSTDKFSPSPEDDRDASSAFDAVGDLHVAPGRGRY